VQVCCWRSRPERSVVVLVIVAVGYAQSRYDVSRTIMLPFAHLGPEKT
jgi:hypothetical protein